MNMVDTMDMFFWLICFAAGVGVGVGLQSRQVVRKSEAEVPMEGEVGKPSIVYGDNVEPPKYHGYNPRTFTNVTACTHCELTGLYEDLPITQGCPRCGGKLYEKGNAKLKEINGKHEWAFAPKPHIK